MNTAHASLSTSSHSTLRESVTLLTASAVVTLFPPLSPVVATVVSAIFRVIMDGHVVSDIRLPAPPSRPTRRRLVVSSTVGAFYFVDVRARARVRACVCEKKKYITYNNIYIYTLICKCVSIFIVYLFLL